LEGVGTESNFERACEWFRKGAEQGNPESQCRLGTMYALGQGVAQDDRLALEWLNKSAAQGLSNALFALDVLYPDEVSGPRVPPEIVPRVERFVEEMVERIGRDRPDILANFERLSTSNTEAGSEELAIDGCAHKPQDVGG
jgi:TPR repeat protein